MKTKFKKTIKKLLNLSILMIFLMLISSNAVLADNNFWYGTSNGYIGPFSESACNTANSGNPGATSDCFASNTDPNTGNPVCPTGQNWSWPAGHCVNSSGANPNDITDQNGNPNILNPLVTQNPTPTSTTYKFLAPFSDQYKIFDVKDGACPFGRYLNMMITIFIGISAVLAMIMIIMGGIEYMTSELVSSKEAGKEKITHAVLGLLLALAAFLILNTINPSILKSCLKVDLININVPPGVDVPQTPVNGMLCAGPAYKVGTAWDDLVGTKTKLPDGVTDNHGGADCQKVGQGLPGIGGAACTSTRGLDTSVLVAVVNACKHANDPSWWEYVIPVYDFYALGQVAYNAATATNCDIMLTGGTECWWHDPAGGHRVGSSTVDIRHSDSLDSFILKRGKLVHTNSLGEPTYNVRGINYFQEGGRGNQSAHWHVFRGQ